MTLLTRETSAPAPVDSTIAKSPTSVPPNVGLSDDFAGAGFAGPIRILSPVQCRRFLRAADEARLTPPIDWDKGHAVTSRAFYEIATHPSILQVVSNLLGPDIMLWGASLLSRP